MPLRSLVKFVLVFVTVVIIGKSAYLATLALSHPGGFFYINGAENFSLLWIFQLLIQIIVKVTGKVLYFLGYSTFQTSNWIAIKNSQGVFIGWPCLGYQFWMVGSAFILAYPSSTGFMIKGIVAYSLLIVVLNIVRISILCIMVYSAYEQVIKYDLHDQFNLLLTAFAVSFCVVWVGICNVKSQIQS